MITRARNFYSRNQRWLPIAFFVAGFIFDALVLRRIDELLTIVQQAVYLFISASLICVELLDAERHFQPPAWLQKVWLYREALLHFLMGTLLNAYTIFYFKSASAITSFVFILVLAGILIINEFKHFGERQTQVHVAILSLCLISYSVVLAPILLGFIGWLPFICANVGAVLVMVIYHASLRSFGVGLAQLRRDLILPFASVQTLFVLLYFFGLIPPVPLSVSYMGIYHDVKREGSEYALTYTRSEARFWEHGDQTFTARPGDVVHCFVRIFAPSKFKDQLQVRWLFKDEKRGWLPSDAIPLAITGGREEGFRGVTKKSNYQPGSWRVQIETMDGHELGRIGFEIVRDESADLSTDPASKPASRTVFQ